MKQNLPFDAGESPFIFSALKVLCLSLILTACGGGGGGGGDDNASTQNTTSNDTTNTTTQDPAPTIPIHSDDYAIYLDKVYPDIYTGSVDSGNLLTVNKNGNFLTSVTINGTRSGNCPISVDNASFLGIDETLGHYVLYCNNLSDQYALYIVDSSGTVLWQATSYLASRPAQQEFLLTGGSLYILNEPSRRLDRVSYTQSASQQSFYSFQLESGYTGARVPEVDALGGQSKYNQMHLLADGRLVINTKEYATSGNQITSSAYFLHIVNSDGSLDMKLSQREITAWMGTQTGGSYTTNTYQVGVDAEANYNIWFNGSSGSGAYLSLGTDDFPLLQELITPPAANGDFTISDSALSSCTSSTYDNSLNTGDPQVDLYCQGAHIYACAGDSTAVGSYCQILGGFSSTYKNQCSYCAGF